MRRLPVIEVRDDLVICGGVHPTAALHADPEKPRGAVAETHQLLRPAFHLGEITAAGEIAPGDAIEETDGGKKLHRPARKRHG